MSAEPLPHESAAPSQTAGGPVGVLLDLPGWAGVVFILGLFAAAVAARIPHPFDLEWMEGGMLVHGLRVLQGQPLYVLPSSEFIPYIYPPLYSWLLALGGLVVPLDYPLGRAISTVGSLAGAAALVAAARLEGARWLLAAGAGAVFLSTFENSGQFFDLVRIDGLLIGLLAWALVAGRAAWWRAAGVLLVLAYATKHSAAAFGLPMLWWAWRQGGRDQAQRFVLWSVVPALIFTGLMLLEGDGLFLTYLLGVPGAHPLVGLRILKTPWEIFLAMPALLVVAGLAAARDRSWLQLRAARGGHYWVLCGGLAVVLSAVMRGHHGGYLNVLIPGMWAASLAVALALHHAESWWPGRLARGLVGLVLGAQLVQGAWEHDRVVPTQADVEAGDRILEVLAEYDDPILAPWNPWLAVQSGHAPGFHLIALWDVADHDGPLQDASRSIDADIAAGRFTAILTSNDKLGHGLKSRYRRAENVRPAGSALKPRTGWPVRPSQLWEPKPSRE